jgi:hypothetical protein
MIDPRRGLSVPAQQAIRAALSAVLDELAAGTRTLPPLPDDDTMVEMMGVCLGERVPREYVTMAMEEMGFRDRRLDWRTPPSTARRGLGLPAQGDRGPRPARAHRVRRRGRGDALGRRAPRLGGDVARGRRQHARPSRACRGHCGRAAQSAQGRLDPRPRDLHRRALALGAVAPRRAPRGPRRRGDRHRRERHAVPAHGGRAGTLGDRLPALAAVGAPAAGLPRHGAPRPGVAAAAARDEPPQRPPARAADRVPARAARRPPRADRAPAWPTAAA